VTAPRKIAEGVSELGNDLRIDAWDLCAEFVQSMVAEAQSLAGEDGRSALPVVDWAAIWNAGDGGTSDELAIGRIVRAASEAARGVTPGREAPPAAPAAPDDGLNGAVGSGAALLTLPPEGGDELGHSADPSALQVESNIAQAEPLVAPPELVSIEPEPASMVVEPVTQPVPISTEPRGSATVAPPERFTKTLPEPPITEQVEAVDAGTVVQSVAEEVSSDELDDEASRTGQKVPAHSASYHVFTWMRNVGVIILLFVVWQLWGTDIAQHHAQNQLQNQFEASVRAHKVPAVAGTGKGLIAATTEFAPAADGSVLARLQIPLIGVDQYVIEGTTADDLSRGPGHYVGTAVPGQAGNVAIAGHRTTHGAPFNGLGHLVSGSQIILTTTWGEKLTYVVSGTPQVVSPGDVGVLNYFGDNRITLTTCNPEFSSSQRLVVVGTLRQPLGTHVALPTHLLYHVANTGTASWNWSLLPLVGIEICLLLLLALSYRLFDGWFGSGRRWLILIPLWAAGLYLLFGTLTLFLPSSI
jgi:LPXTG-site transpeptidase (sortase) family protein